MMDTKSIVELKPCPFCGKPAYYDWDNDGNAKDLGCSDDDCAGHLVFSIWHTDIGTKHESEAIETWNKRAQCAELERLRRQNKLYSLASLYPEELQEEARNNALEEAAQAVEDYQFNGKSASKKIRALKDKQQ